MIDGGCSQIFFEDNQPKDVPESDKLKELKAQKESIEKSIREITEG
jgi:hypothetical protein